MNWKITVTPTAQGWRVKTKHDGDPESALVEQYVTTALLELQRKLSKVRAR